MNTVGQDSSATGGAFAWSLGVFEVSARSLFGGTRLGQLFPPSQMSASLDALYIGVGDRFDDDRRLVRRT